MPFSYVDERMDAISTGQRGQIRLGKSTLTKFTFRQVLTTWQKEAPHGEDRTAAVSAFLVAYRTYLDEPDLDFAMSLNHSIFTNISSFSSLSLERYFPDMTSIDFSNCAALTELPDALLNHVPVIDITHCTSLRLHKECLPVQLKLKGADMDEFGIVTAFVPVGSVDEQWAKYLCYKNLPVLAEQRQIVRPTKNGDFFIIQHLEKSQVLGRKMISLGWKLHISVHPSDHENAFDLAAGIISQFCYNFKVTIPEKVVGDRLYEGGQITIYVEDVERPVITSKYVEAMMTKVTQAFLDNGIRVGTKPGSDLPMKSPYFSMRNSKFESILRRHDADYLEALAFGNNPNPANYPNPFSRLLKSADSFDPSKHFALFELTETPNLLDCFYKTMVACLHEYTEFDGLDDALKEKVLLQCFLGNADADNAAKLTASFIKEAYKNNSKIQLTVMQAIRIIFIYETFGKREESKIYEYINGAQLSLNKYDKSFEKVIVCVKQCSKLVIETVGLEKNKSFFFLLDILKKSAIKVTEGRTDTELIALVKTGHLYNSQAALTRLEKKLSAGDFKQFLKENGNLVAVQLCLMAQNAGKPALVKAHLYEALALDEFDVIEPSFDHVQMMLNTHTLNELQAASRNGKPIATYTLLCIYARHLVRGKCTVPDNITTAAPRSRSLARECMNKLASNTLYEKALVRFEGLPSEKK